MGKRDEIEKLRILFQTLEHAPLYDKLRYMVENGVGTSDRFKVAKTTFDSNGVIDRYHVEPIDYEDNDG